MVMEIYHLVQTQRFKEWTISKTAEHFGVSIGLASENLKLAHAIHLNAKYLEVASRNEALTKLRRNGNGRSVAAERL